MIRLAAISWITLASALSGQGEDLMRFANGDQLHGTFTGFGEGTRVSWKRDDLAEPAGFKIEDVRHVILRGARPGKSLASLSHLALVNGDKIPGTVVAMDAKSITLETPYAGTLKIPREQVAMFAPSPLGGRLNYHGPYEEDDWRMSNAASPGGLPEGKKDEDGDDKTGRWQFSGSAWFWPGKSYGTALTRDKVLPDRMILKFDISWRNRLSCAVAFHSDFAPRKSGEDEKANRRDGFVPGDSGVLPVLFGNSYVLQLYSTHMMLFRTSADGGPPVRVQINGNSMRLGETGKATVEIRANRITGSIAIFINDEFTGQWSEGGRDGAKNVEYAGKGSGIGFVVQNDESPVKITDIMVAEWNGMPDSARSLQVAEQDIVLLSNGTDRFSGKVGSLENGKIQLEGKYGRFQFEVADIAEIRFAKDRLAKPEEPGDKDMVVRMSPLGSITGQPLSGNGTSIHLLSPICGELEFNLDSAVMLDFKRTQNIMDDWDAEF